MPLAGKHALILGLASGAILLGLAAANDLIQKKTGSEPTFRIEVDTVSLPVVVTTRDNRRITDLKREDFQVFEDGVPQEIMGFAAVDEPVSVTLVLDTSGSTESQLKRIQDEAIRFVNLLHRNDSVAVLSFADKVKLQADFSIDRSKCERGIRGTLPGGLTALHDAVYLALKEVLGPIPERKALVLFTDGVDNRSFAVSAEETLELAREAKVIIYSVYFNTEAERNKRAPRLTFPPIQRDRHEEAAAGHDYLMELAQCSGGLVFDATKMGDLGPAFRNIAQELSCLYSIGYNPTNTTRNGQFRTVTVKLKKPGLAARTIKGYFPRKDK
ncbi:MAG: VWA domain-containing protein [Acidobacteriia bacterium]|nr:VWA domain-containing protein [Terriglobia bacterium]